MFLLLHLLPDYLCTMEISSCHSLFENFQSFPVTEWSPKGLHDLVPTCLYINFLARVMSSTPSSLPLYSSHGFPAVPKHAPLFVSPCLCLCCSFCFPPCSSGKPNPPFKIQPKCHLLCKDHHPQLLLANLVTLPCAAISYISLCNSTYCAVNACIICPLIMPGII